MKHLQSQAQRNFLEVYGFVGHQTIQSRSHLAYVVKPQFGPDSSLTHQQLLSEPTHGNTEEGMMRQKPEPSDVDFLFLQNLAPATVSPDVCVNGVCLQLPSSTSSLLGLPPSPSFLPSFPSCPEVIFAGTVVELRCVMTTQSWDFMMQSMSKISKRTKEGFFKALWISRGELHVGNMSP